MPRRIAVLVKGYPRLSETFIAQELLGLEQRGLDLLIVSLRHPTDPDVHDLHRRIRAPVLYLPEYVKDEPLRVLGGFWRSLRLPGFPRVLAQWLADFVRDPTPNRGRRFAQAAVLAAELPADIEHLYVHYLHTPGSVGRYTGMLRGLPFSFSAHAKDIWTTPAWEKRAKLASAAWTVTCTRANLEHLREIAPDAAIDLVHHGLDPTRFAAPPEAAHDTAVILCVARAVEKKGLDVLLDALARLPAGLDWRFEHIGGGSLTDALRARAERLGIAGRVRWLGAQAQSEVIAAYRRAAVFCLPARVAGDGDRDGLPNVLMEAMSQELPVVSTPISGIPEIVEHEVSGLLAPSGDAEALAAALQRLLGDADLRQRLGQAGRRRVLADFAMERGIDRIAGLLIGQPAPAEDLACASPSMPL